MHQGELHQQPLVLRASVLHVRLVEDVQPTHQEEQIGTRSLVLEFGLHVLGGFQKLQGLGIAGHHQIAEVSSPPRDEVMRVEPARHDVVEQQHGPRNVAGQRLVGEHKIRVVVEHMQLLGDGLVGQVLACERHELVEHRQRVAQRAVRFLCDDVQRFLLSLHPLLRRNVLQVGHGIWHRDAVEVENLATRQDGGKDLVLFCRGQDEDGVGWRFLKGLQERVERRLAQHVHLVDDVHLVFALLGRDADLVHNAPDVFHLVVGRRVELKDVERQRLVLPVKAVDGLGENARRGGFAHTTWTAEEVGLGDLARGDALLQGLRDAGLPHHRVPSLGTVFSRTDEVGLIAHDANIDPHSVEGQIRLFTTRPHFRHAAVGFQRD